MFSAADSGLARVPPSAIQVRSPASQSPVEAVSWQHREVTGYYQRLSGLSIEAVTLKHLLPEVVQPEGQEVEAVEDRRQPPEFAALQEMGAQVKKEKRPQETVHWASPGVSDIIVTRHT